MEALLETLVAKISAYEEEEEAQKMMTPESIGNDVLTPFATASSDATNSTPLITIFDSPVVSIDLFLPGSENSQEIEVTCATITNV